MGISVERLGAVTRIVIDRQAAMNSLDVPSMIALREAFLSFRDDTDARVAILRGAGDVAFCAGADLKNTMPPSTGFASSHFEPIERSIELGEYTRAISLDEMGIQKPVIASVNGHALGGGCEMALACDLRIGSTTATFGLTEVKWATVPALGGISRLIDAVPPAVAMKMLLTGDRIDANEAYRLGLISDLVEPERLDEVTLEIAERIAANGPLAVRSIKDTADRARNLPLSEAIAIEQLMWGVLRDTADRREGRIAFTEKRPPEYRGE